MGRAPPPGVDAVTTGVPAPSDRETWLRSATDWARHHSGCPDLHLEEVVTEAWSTVWRSTAPAGDLWFKESRSANLAEGRVHDVLAGLAPDQVTAPVAWDNRRGWLLTRDGGVTVMDSSPSDRGLAGSVAQDLLADYAQLQRATIGQRDVLVSAGLPEGLPHQAEQLLQACVTEMAALPTDDPRHVSATEAHQLLTDGAQAVREAGRLLTDGPVPLAFDHNDLFPRNVFLPQGGGNYRFFDFAESLWAHPFGSLLMLLWELIRRHRLDVGDSGTIDVSHTPIRAVFDSYLQEWTEYTALHELRQLAGLALQIAPLYRTSTWLTVLRRNPNAVGDHGSTPRAWIFDVTRPVVV